MKNQDLKGFEFYGSATVGDRGQISLPVEVRRKYGINPGDKLLILSKGDLELWGIMLVKADVLSKLLEKFEKNIKEMLKEG